MKHDINPYAATPAVLVAPRAIRTVGRIRFWSAIGLAVVLVAGSVPAAAMAIRDIESIMVSAAVFVPSALILSVLALPAMLRPLQGISISMLLIVVGCFLTIALNSWSPSDAQRPIGWTTVACATGLQLGWMPIIWVGFRFRNSAAAQRDAETATAVVSEAPFSQS